MSDQSILDAARKRAGLSLSRAERMSGTGASATVRVTGILKFAEDPSETTYLERLSSMLGEDYPTLFPRFRELQPVDGFFVTELEYLGDATFEQLLLGGALAPAGARVVDRVSGFIERMSSERPPCGEDGYQHAFMVELLVALGLNAQAAQLNVPPLRPEDRLDRFKFVSCLCHRDLSAGNVMCAPNGDARLIDPRPCLPGARHCSVSPYGSSAVDAAAFLVSLERKELERANLGLPALGLTERFCGIVDGWIKKGLFNEAMLDLCLAHAYSVYAGCRCDYCLAPERKWLYDLMRERFEEVSRRIA